MDNKTYTYNQFSNQKELHNDLVVSWNETEEAITSLKELNNDDLIENKEHIIKRLENVLHWLGKYVSEDDVLFEKLD